MSMASGNLYMICGSKKGSKILAIVEYDIFEAKRQWVAARCNGILDACVICIETTSAGREVSRRDITAEIHYDLD